MPTRTVFADEWVKASPMTTKHEIDTRCDRCHRASMARKMVSIRTVETLCIACWAHRVGPAVHWELTGQDTMPKLPKEYLRSDGSRPPLPVRENPFGPQIASGRG